MLAIGIADQMVAHGHIEPEPDVGRLIKARAAFLKGIGVDSALGNKRPGAMLCRPCLD